MDSKTRSGLVKSLPQYLMLVGLPGSGKSTFARQLERSCPDGHWVRVSQDELRSRDQCEVLVARALVKQGSTSRVILDRCNSDPEERKAWLDVAMRPRNTIAVFFDVPKDECVSRVKARRNHPTIKQGHGTRIVEDMAKKIVAPKKTEGFSEIVTVQSLEDTNSLLLRLGGEALAYEDLNDEEDAASSVPEAGSASSDGASSDEKGKRAAGSADSSSGRAQTLENFYKFPRTHHLFDAGGSGVSRDDLVMDPKELGRFANGATTVIVEEKVDGANLGISLDENYRILCQNRSHYVNSQSHKQFGQLDAWVKTHESELCAILEPRRHVLFGEWVYAMHSIHYTRLPDYFLAFDIFDVQENKFMSRARRNALLETTSIATVPLVAERVLKDKDELRNLLMTTKSTLYDGNVEGLYLRVDDAEGEWLVSRGKVVRPDFIQNITEQWTKKPFVKNMIDYAA